MFLLVFRVPIIGLVLFPEILSVCLGDICHFSLQVLLLLGVLLIAIVGVVPYYLFLLLGEVVIVLVRVAVVEALVEPARLAESDAEY